LIATAVALSCAACDPVTLTVVGAGGAVGMGASEERGLEGAIDDTKIRADINQLWAANNFDTFRQVSMTITEGRVLLTGSVEKPETRVDAVRLAWQASGVRQVIDEIQVTDESGVMDYLRDSWIADKLRTQLLFDGKVRNVNYTVDVVNGVVYLMGIAQDQDELDRVIAYARDISDVKKVVSHVLLKTDPKRNASG
jgi:osmotically-inducible protein OsmY